MHIDVSALEQRQLFPEIEGEKVRSHEHVDRRERIIRLAEPDMFEEGRLQIVVQPACDNPHSHVGLL